MKIEKCKWKYNAQSPVMFMIDDFTNVWIDKNNNGKLDIGEDWGHCTEDKNSFWNVLNKNILSVYPELKVTLFAVVGKRAPIINTGNYTYAGTILDDVKFLEFINKLDKNSKVEIAYHGLTHGVPQKSRYEFIEEWQSYESLGQALETIEEGKEIFYKALGRCPNGGKYCGYKYNQFSDESIHKSGFTWWCRHWDAGLQYSPNKEYSYDLETFYDVVDIPSTVDGSFYSLMSINNMFTKKYIKSTYEKFSEGRTLEKQIEKLINNNQIISIQEHTSPYRADDRIQYPNIISDMNNLKYIFSYLRRYDLWYATGTEIADYYLLYKNTKINQSSYGFFYLNTTKELIGKEITLKLEDIDYKTPTIKICNQDNEFIFYNKYNAYIGTVSLSEDPRYEIYCE